MSLLLIGIITFCIDKINGNKLEEILNKIPLPSLRRLPRYLIVLEKLQRNGRTTVSATDVAEELDLKPIQIRKDMAFTGIVGKPKVGYDINELISSIRTFIGWHDVTPCVLIGAGSLGKALIGYEEFAERNLKIVAAFDINPDKHGMKIYQTPVYSNESITYVIEKNNISMAIITVPAAAAQDVTNILIAAGISGIWNFSPTEIQVPPNVTVKRENLSEGLAVLFVKMRERQIQLME